MKDFIDAYIELEKAINKQIGSLFYNDCAMCSACCCRVDICEEAAESAFLSKLLQHQKVALNELDYSYGWLASDGCRLSYGRPPVCYTFFCKDLLAIVPDETTRWIIQVLGRLIEYVGEDTDVGIHLTEIRKEDQLLQLDNNLLFERLETAQNIYHIIEKFLESGRLSASEKEELEIIEINED